MLKYSPSHVHLSDNIIRQCTRLTFNRTGPSHSLESVRREEDEYVLSMGILEVHLTHITRNGPPSYSIFFGGLVGSRFVFLPMTNPLLLDRLGSSNNGTALPLTK